MNNTRILVVEDDVNLGQILQEYLKLKGFITTLSTNGDAGLTAFYEGLYDLCLLDLMMPDISGLDVLKQLKGNPVQRNIPVIMVTASDEVDTAAECIKNGADDFVTKPFLSLIHI